VGGGGRLAAAAAPRGRGRAAGRRAPRAAPDERRAGRHSLPSWPAQHTALALSLFILLQLQLLEQPRPEQPSSARPDYRAPAQPAACQLSLLFLLILTREPIDTHIHSMHVAVVAVSYDFNSSKSVVSMLCM
jgi:hypothetical protein